MASRRDLEEKLIQDLITLVTSIKDTDGIKKIQDAVTAIILGDVDVSDRATRELGKATIKDIEKVVDVSKYLSPTALGAGGTATVWTPASGKAIRAKRIQVSVDAATRIDFRWATTAFESYYLPAPGSIICNLVGCNEEPAADTSLTILSSAGANVTAKASGDEV